MQPSTWSGEPPHRRFALEGRIGRPALWWRSRRNKRQVTGEDDAFEQLDDVADTLGETADSSDAVRRRLPEDILQKYEVHSYRHAAVILSETRREEFVDVLTALRQFTVSTDQIKRAGGNESEIPKTFSATLRSKGWHETTVQGDLLVRRIWRAPGCTPDGRPFNELQQSVTWRRRYLDGHKIDYVKGRVAFDLEWNSKDQTFDRDLYAFSAFFQCGVIDAAVLVTRSAELNAVFRALGPSLKRDGSPNGKPRLVSEKYGASTTWMGKLLYRLNAGRNGGCPVLVFGIRPGCISDWSRDEQA